MAKSFVILRTSASDQSVHFYEEKINVKWLGNSTLKVSKSLISDQSSIRRVLVLNEDHMKSYSFLLR